MVEDSPANMGVGVTIRSGGGGVGVTIRSGGGGVSPCHIRVWMKP